MYEFTNGVVVFDEKTKDRYIEAGYRLVEDKTIVNNNSIEMVVPLDTDLNKAISEQLKKVINENTFDNGIIEEQPRKRNKLSK
nr:MAG TPA: hypothetical protein [Caudoviricetes sp.]